jgi:hypothetical protein
MKDRWRISSAGSSRPEQLPVSVVSCQYGKREELSFHLTDNWQLTLTTHDDFREGFKVVAAAARDPQRLRPLAIGGVVRSSLL